jgi:WD40 repeat protein
MKTRLVLSLFFLAIGGHRAMVLAQSAGTFTATGSMTIPRFSHTATLLQNGKVLIAGGYTICFLEAQPCVGPNSAELYDPITGAFTATGAMHTIRPIGGNLLPNGKVLFAESFPTPALASIELYDPSTGNFISAGAAATLRGVSATTLLNDGRVLLMGWSGTAGAAEIYDAVSESFSPASNWPQDVWSVSVLAVLPDGRVLLDYPALYDPAAGTFTKMPIWSFNDTPPAALLPDGKVLLTGGNTDFGGDVNWAELFDLKAGGFFTTGRMSSVRDGHTANLLPDGTVLIAGGATTFNAATRSTLVTSSAEIYDPVTGTFSQTGSMTAPRLFHAAMVLSNGQVFISGGELSSPPEGPGRVFSGSSSAELYTPAVLIPAPALFSLSSDGKGQGAIWHAATGQVASTNNPAIAGETLSMYTTSLADGGVIPPQVAIGNRLAEILYFGGAPGYPGYNQVNFRLPNGVPSGLAVPVRLTYLGRPSNEVTIGVQ